MRKLSFDDVDILEPKHYKYKSMDLYVGQKNQVSAMKVPFMFQLGVVQGLVRSILSLYQTHSTYPPDLELYKLHSQSHIQAKMLFSSMLSESSTLPEIGGAINLYYYQSLAELYTPSVYNYFLQKKIFTTLIRSFPGDIEFFKWFVRYEQIIRYQDGAWNLYLAVSFTTNNIPKTYSKWTEIASKVQQNYDHLTSQDSYCKRSEEHMSCTEDLYLVLSVLLAEVNGTFGINNSYNGEYKFQGHTFPLSTTIWFEIPMAEYNNLSSSQLEHINNSETRIFQSC